MFVWATFGRGELCFLVTAQHRKKSPKIGQDRFVSSRTFGTYLQSSEPCSQSAPPALLTVVKPSEREAYLSCK